MRNTLLASSVALLMITFTTISCSKDGDSGDGPIITSITPSTALTGETIIITGTNLTNSSVTIGGIAAEIIDNTSTSITTKIPAGASPGLKYVKVTNPEGSAAGNITVTGAGAGPVITSIAPANIAVGGEITIAGTGLSGAVVRIATKVSTITANTSTSIKVIVPTVALGSAAVQVITSLGDITSNVNVVP